MKTNSKVVMSITDMKDIKKLKENSNIKYINLDVQNPNLEVIYYLLEHGQNYSYAEKIDNTLGYIYISYDIFKQSELFILEIINNIPINLNKLEIARYLYITIGKNIGYDINIIPDKNETINLQAISSVGNIWGSIANSKGTNITITRLYLYLCRLMNIDCKIISTTSQNYFKNMLTIDKRTIIVSLYDDIPFIQGSFKTKNFIGYNDDINLDKKISYIKDDYSENKIDNALSKMDYSNPNFFQAILIKTQNIINVSSIKPIELATIYDIIFTKYCPNTPISINNLYINTKEKDKEHFILITYDNKYYSYNYTRKSFVEISEEEIIKNIETKKIGVYLNESIPFQTKNKKQLA